MCTKKLIEMDSSKRDFNTFYNVFSVVSWALWTFLPIGMKCSCRLSSTSAIPLNFPSTQYLLYCTALHHFYKSNILARKLENTQIMKSDKYENIHDSAKRHERIISIFVVVLFLHTSATDTSLNHLSSFYSTIFLPSLGDGVRSKSPRHTLIMLIECLEH